MIFLSFDAEADVVGRRLRVSWELDLAALAGAPAPAARLRRKERDFEFPPPAAPDPFLVYDSTVFPPAGTQVVELPGWEEHEGARRTHTTVESVRRPQPGPHPWIEVLRRTTTTTFDDRGLAVARRVTVLDVGLLPAGALPAGLAAATPYYYQLESAGIEPLRAVASPGEAHGTARALYELLPQIHRRHDTVQRLPTPGAEAVPEARVSGGQLRRLLDLFGAPLDLVRSRTDELLGLRDVDRVDHRLLPHLAQWLGWELGTGVSIPEQRQEIRLAPHFYQLTGTVPGTVLWAGRLTGWPCQAKEFIHNVFRTNAPEEPELWEVWGRRDGAGGWSAPTPVTRTEGFDGRPAAGVDAGGVVWLFWHGDRAGRRELWLQALGVDPTPRRVMAGAPDDGPELSFTDEQPAVVRRTNRWWLFWSSDRAGGRDIWMREFTSLPAGPPERLTGPGSDDREPAAALDAGGQLHLFWVSDRRGRPEVWSRRHDGAAWQAPERLTTAVVADAAPAAVSDAAGRLWLFWSADLGDRSRIFARVRTGGVWGAPVALSADGLHRDEAPAVVRRGGELWLFWHSNQGGVWRLHLRFHDGTNWSATTVLSTGVGSDKEPTGVVAPGGDLHLFWRTDRGAARFRSRTVDVDDAEALARLGSFDDRWHYSFDTGTTETDWYAPDTVGLYLQPTTADPAEIARGLDRVRRFMEPFRPVPVRLVPILEAPLADELVEPPAPIGEELEDVVI